jgi:hypothetical protein
VIVQKGCLGSCLSYVCEVLHELIHCLRFVEQLRQAQEAITAKTLGVSCLQTLALYLSSSEAKLGCSTFLNVPKYIRSFSHSMFKQFVVCRKDSQD